MAPRSSKAGSCGIASNSGPRRRFARHCDAARPCVAEAMESRTLLTTYSLQTLISLGGNSNLAATNPSLLVTSNDAVYGTAPRGGIDLSGSIFALPRGATQFITLAFFTGAHGADPAGGLVMDAAGNLYGATVYTTSGITGNNSRPTGAFGAGDGTIFELPKGSATITTLATFDGANGQSPQATLVMDSNGNLFGTTRAGGANNDGTVFELSSGSRSITTLASFSGADGRNPISPLTLDAAGNLFGTTPSGGSSGDGTVFEIPSGGSLTTLASFNGANGSAPAGGLIQDAAGNLYGTAGTGGAQNDGEVYEIASAGNAITPIASFSGTDGSNPQGSLAIDSSGDLFGTAHVGGAGDDGTVFEIARGSNAITTIAAFSGVNGSLPTGLTGDGNGNFFAITSAGGGFGLGTLDRVLQGGNANVPGYFNAVMGRTTLPPVVVGGAFVYSFATVGLTDVLPVNGPVTIRLFASSDGAIDASSTLVRNFVAYVNVKANTQFAINVPILSLPTTLPTGFYRLLAQAVDPVGNVATATAGPGLQIVAPAVAFSGVLSRITLPAQVLSGSRTPAVATILLSNTGTIPSEGLVTVQLYFSPDGTVGNGTPITAAGRLLYFPSGTAAVINVPLGAIPAGLAGTYNLVAQVTGRTGATTTIVSNTSYAIEPGVAGLSAAINAFNPTTVHRSPASTVVASVTLTNTGNLPIGGPRDPLRVNVSLVSGDGTQNNPVRLFPFAIRIAPGQSRNLTLRFRTTLLASVSPGTWFPMVSVTDLSGEVTASAVDTTAITIA